MINLKLPSPGPFNFAPYCPSCRLTYTHTHNLRLLFLHRKYPRIEEKILDTLLLQFPIHINFDTKVLFSSTALK